ncbi:MAG TPA: hypothetical protein DEF47_09650 [Herpetosiphon sp.]|nr:hypothetical protein [Herpetosiphon sp.]
MTHTASQIVLMEGFQAFFDYDFMPICGIPNITLLGTPADWHSIAERVKWLATFDLGWWTERLASICEGLILTIEGQPPHRFWQQIYHQTSGFCDDKIDGWIIDLFPYIKKVGKPGQLCRNPMLAHQRQLLDDPLASPSIQLTQPEPLVNLAEIEPFDPEVLEFETESRESGLAPWIFPSGLAKVTTTYREHIDGPATKVRLVAGLIGTGYNRDTNQLSPEIGWAVY